MRHVSSLVRLATATALAAFAAVDPALAGITPVPGPVIGAGLPALALFGAGYWLIRRRRKA